jgi:hypothetical protein
MPYRSEAGATEARRAELLRELEELKPRVNHLAYLKWKQGELERAIAELDRVRAPRTNRREKWILTGIGGFALMLTSAITVATLLRPAPSPPISCIGCVSEAEHARAVANAR